MCRVRTGVSAIVESKHKEGYLFGSAEARYPAYMLS